MQLQLPSTRPIGVGWKMRIVESHPELAIQVAQLPKIPLEEPAVEYGPCKRGFEYVGISK